MLTQPRFDGDRLGSQGVAAGAPPAIRRLQALAFSALAVLVLTTTLGLGESPSGSLANSSLLVLVVVLAIALLLTRSVLRREERAAWVVVTGGMVTAVAGSLYYLLASGGDPAAAPWLGDALLLATYPATYVALMLLVWPRLSGRSRTLWLDGLTVSLALAALGAALLLELIVEATQGDIAAIAINLAYPLADIVLLSFVVGIFALSGWHPDRRWLLIGTSMAVGALADAIFLWQAALGRYVEGTLLDLLWLASMLLLATAAWAPGHRAPIRLEGRPLFIVPAACGLLALTILVLDHFRAIGIVAIALAVLTLLAVITRTALTVFENERMSADNRRHAETDALTGLGNRRKLFTDLAHELASASHADPRMLVLFDLDGFKHYNDSFGHPAGDALLTRLSGKLAHATQPYGTSYRLGGDEFCVLTTLRRATAEHVIKVTTDALTEHGDGFSVTTSYGATFLPEEATDGSDALRMADERLYREKQAKAYRRSSRELVEQALVDHDLQEHGQAVADLAVCVGERLQLSAPELEELARAAQFHDLGKIAIPDDILNKPEPLTESELMLLREHPIVGERILGLVPAFRPAGKLVRSTHERWDGHGYPDGLAGTQIPLPARIIAACDAYVTITTERSYHPARTTHDAIAEIHRCAGSQFDPTVTSALAAAIGDREPHDTEAHTTTKRAR
jgi:two-component system cell cycle response regulator